MKIPDEVLRKLVWGALFSHDGDRDKAAGSLNMSRRTLDRWIAKLDLYGDIDKMGWRRPGPPRSTKSESVTLRMMILAWIKKHRGKVDFGALAKELYGEDSRVTRQRLYFAFDQLKKQGALDFNVDTSVYTVRELEAVK